MATGEQTLERAPAHLGGDALHLSHGADRADVVLGEQGQQVGQGLGGLASSESINGLADNREGVPTALPTGVRKLLNLLCFSNGGAGNRTRPGRVG